MASAATQPLRITRVDTSRLPLVAVTVQAPASLAAKGTPAFTVTENGGPSRVCASRIPNKGATIVEIIDTSRSMKGEPLAKALAAARTFSAAKRADRPVLGALVRQPGIGGHAR